MDNRVQLWRGLTVERDGDRECVFGGVVLCLLVGYGAKIERGKGERRGLTSPAVLRVSKLSFTTIVNSCPCATAVNLHEELLQ